SADEQQLRLELGDSASFNECAGNDPAALGYRQALQEPTKLMWGDEPAAAQVLQKGFSIYLGRGHNLTNRQTPEQHPCSGLLGIVGSGASADFRKVTRCHPDSQSKGQVRLEANCPSKGGNVEKIPLGSERREFQAGSVGTSRF